MPGERVHNESIIAYARLSATERDALHTEAENELQQCNDVSICQSLVKELTTNPSLHMRGSQPLREIYCTLKPRPSCNSAMMSAAAAQ